MLRLKHLEIEGFGPFADQQRLVFPPGDGVIVIYGENMRGKTTLLNAIRYAFFGKVLGRGRRQREIHLLSNRERAKQGVFGFSVNLSFDFDGEAYELVRSHSPKIAAPVSDSDYQAEILLKRGRDVLGQQDRERILAQIFPEEISRFFLFDGELLQEYEELIINDSETKPQISQAIEKILGVPILKSGRRHLRELAEEAERQVAVEASRHSETANLGSALKNAMTIREGQRGELERLEKDLEERHKQRSELEEKLASNARAADLMRRRQDALNRASDAAAKQVELRGEVKRLMADGWRAVLLGPVRRLREEATRSVGAVVDATLIDLRRQAISTGDCAVCEQPLDQATRNRLNAGLASAALPASGEALARLRAIGGFKEKDVSGEVRQLIRQIDELKIEEQHQTEEADELFAQIADTDQNSVRSTQASLAETNKHIGILESGVQAQADKLAEQERRVDGLKRKLSQLTVSSNLAELEAGAKQLRDGEALFDAAVQEYKQDLRERVEKSASDLFLEMSTERTDYAGLTINEEYGLTIRHVDGTPEHARSAGAEHIVALALMGALQQNAPLRGPIVMDSPFGRLDEGHTSNVLRGLHRMADQVVLLVYEAEVGRDEARRLLGGRLITEYELRKINSRRTEIVEVRR
jgi:DNA sulfur modification protein DndD